ncbi:LysR family transcriptional regulator ArgP [Salinisphaera sp. Q1T1-3]|uniref:LysR family transcriptional regulator ArgP n=1 Tax=Salinisphaera sp. Q1T1-3 TaxID=2321229 RepID=UPI000E769ECC|nr:LysR family transcriptional regulator ArgP [Salinisphaera sp. Q1T1-3]RJS92476.1 LysR family transcriptional regulator ArgP [Salinisphaera sp. Q1T1-3]
MTLDTAQLAALAAVVQAGSFERAAADLHITPSAVSQRIARLEDRLGQVLVVRGAPVRPTGVGRRLVAHAERVAALEQDTLGALGLAGPATTRLSIAVNADSLASWFAPVLAEPLSQHLDVTLDNEDHSIDWLRRGDVSAAIGAAGDPITGCACEPLGTLRYRAVATPAFIARWLGADITPAAMARAPALAFNTADRLQARWLAARLGPIEPAVGHRLPSAEAFVAATLAGSAWSLNPEPLIAAALADGRLVELIPDTPLDIALYWHYPRRLGPLLAPLTAAVHHAASTRLRAPAG